MNRKHKKLFVPTRMINYSFFQFSFFVFLFVFFLFCFFPFKLFNITILFEIQLSCSFLL